VVRGKVAIQKSDTPSIVLGQGDCFGEIALFKGVPRTATATCFDDSILMRLSGGDFWTILLTNLGVALTLEKVANIRYKGEILTLT
ncbi:MAG: cyclic nucleotide-binding domain-containing protein, partial [Bdellovibrionota bacterium]